MLQAFSDLKGLSLGALDGDIGSVQDAFFDDHWWTVRYFVVATGNWFTGREVLISPMAIRARNWNSRRLDVYLTREKIRNAPLPEIDQPVSRQFESRYSAHYGYPTYWSGPLLWGAISYPGLNPDGVAGAAEFYQPPQRKHREGDPHLRSSVEVKGYHIRASDGSIGHVEDFLVDDRNWSLRFFVVDTRNWLPGKKVLIATDWIERVDWQQSEVSVAMTRDEVRASPTYDHEELMSSDEQTRLDQYQRSISSRLDADAR
ncbi:MAG TPA: PRC-barrel domain-containing protein [Steroidobacteraceae bacterium]|nr:PRC-barrel domain-containing protein [Steroidobacteraceae bacterium]